MKIKVIEEYKSKEALDLLCQQELYDVLSEDELKQFWLEKRLVFIGAYEDQCIGMLTLLDLKKIINICVFDIDNHDDIRMLLLKSAKKLVLSDIEVCPSYNDIDFFKQNGFQFSNHQDDQYPKMIYQSNITQQFETYDQVHEFIASQKDRVYALDNFQNFMTDMGNPQNLLKTIHIGGTNGKGSTTNYIRSVLQTQGYKVATFTSPVLVTRLEVMRINNQNISEEEIVMYANRYISLWLKYEISMFEIEVFIAIMHFIHHHVDFAIFEVGLGGELDATNIVMPIISAITNIGLDHTEYLGNTYEKIAYTKGGIIKPFRPFITGEKKQICLDVFDTLCQQRHSLRLKMGKIENIHDDDHMICYDYRGYHVELLTSAIYQVQNSALALEILLFLKNNGYIHLSDANLLKGLKEAVWEGRFEIMHTKPLMIIDGAHNKEGMEAFYESAKKYQNIKVIFSALRDKDTHAMLELLLKLTDDVTVCEFDFYRAQSAVKLAESFPVHIEKDWKKAIGEAYQHKGVVFITGSLYFIAQVRSYMQNNC